MVLEYGALPLRRSGAMRRFATSRPLHIRGLVLDFWLGEMKSDAHS
jgi:hypothetical protein